MSSSALLVARALTLTLAVASTLYSAFVTQSLIHTQEVAQGASFTALSVSSIEYYNAAGFTPIDGSQSALYSFDWFVYATDALRPLGLVGILLMLPLSELTSYLFTPFVAIGLLLELAKLIYNALVLFGLFGFSCVSYAFCRNRNPAQPDTPDASYIISTVLSGAFILYYIVLLVLPRALRAKRRVIYTRPAEYSRRR